MYRRCKVELRLWHLTFAFGIIVGTYGKEMLHQALAFIGL